MAHYAFLDKNNIVTEVITGVDETETIEGLTPEEWYEKFRGQKCVRTSYNGNIRGNFAGIGFKYDKTFDVFIAPQPYLDWKLNYTTAQWEPPIVKPADIEGYTWLWSEPNKEWIKIHRPSK
jgi:hypothetical protein